MPRRLTRPEVTTRLAIRALHDTRAGTTQLQLAGIFHVSLRTVSDAVSRPVADWAKALVAAPLPKARAIPPPRPRSTRPHYLTNPVMPEARSFGRGTRSEAELIEQDDGGDGFDADLPADKWQEPSDKGME